MTGIWLSIPLAVIAVTGVWMAFSEGGPRPAPPRGPPAAGAPRPPGGEAGGPRGVFRGFGGPPLASPHLSADAAVAAALQTQPDSRVVGLTVPMQGPGPAWGVQLRAVGAERPGFVRIDDATGQPVEGFGGFGGRGGPPGFGPPRRDPVAMWVRRLHTGEDISPLWKWIITLAGIAPLVLALTGIIRWLGGLGRRRAVQSSQAEAA